MKNNISLLIQQYLECRTNENFVLILDTMRPLLHKYSKQLYYLEYEDCMQEFSITLFECLPKILDTKNPSSCLLFMEKAIRHKFYKLYHQSLKCQSEVRNLKSIEDVTDLYSPDQSLENACFYSDLLKTLSQKSMKEQQIIIMLLSGYSDKEIAAVLKISRQYLNRIKKSIL